MWVPIVASNEESSVCLHVPHGDSNNTRSQFIMQCTNSSMGLVSVVSKLVLASGMSREIVTYKPKHKNKSHLASKAYRFSCEYFRDYVHLRAQHYLVDI
ncbi:hypothetical protein CEXT_258691 [Caerostris extrusa]|uniref:Uncharacterized protein n=1 Tax=Caerostris extrusa TaxID=172846 RepID=A0AAV4M3H0_CAEEX|nr:hypothetical protein CEXT_258691 [Caerostris extrusa]